MSSEKFSQLSIDEEDPFIRRLHQVIRFGVRVLAVLMTLIILWGILDVGWVMYSRLIQPPILVLRISDILFLFGTILVVLIAIEIFLNITLYLREDVIHVKFVIATALMAIARKVIVFDFKEIGYQYVYASAAVVLALGITYWLIMKKSAD
ncbi:phosphate-starvation-inducible PsiE family protein [Thermodesulfobacteriota bacterium]